MKKNKFSDNMFVQSLTCMKNLRSMTVAAMLTAMIIVLDFMSFKVANDLKLNFIFVPIMVCAMLYGPVTCMAVCVIGDVLGVVMSGQGVLPQLMLVELVRGLLMGCIMYRKRPTLGRVVAAQSTANLFVNMILNTLMLMQAGFISEKSVLIAIGSRVIKNIAFLPVEILLLFWLLNALNKAMEKSNLRL